LTQVIIVCILAAHAGARWLARRAGDLRDVKNEDRSDYVYENKGEVDIMSSEKHGILQENATIAR
jgi:hypothetical protein